MSVHALRDKLSASEARLVFGVNPRSLTLYTLHPMPYTIHPTAICVRSSLSVWGTPSNPKPNATTLMITRPLTLRQAICLRSSIGLRGKPSGPKRDVTKCTGNHQPTVPIWYIWSVICSPLTLRMYLPDLTPEKNKTPTPLTPQPTHQIPPLRPQPPNTNQQAHKFKP